MDAGDLQTVLHEAEALGKAQRWDAAIEVLKRGIEHFGDDLELCFALARAYFYLGDHDQSVLGAERVLERDPQHVRAIVQLGWSALVRDQREQALARFEEAMGLGYEDWQLHCQLGLIHASSHRLTAAERHFSRALELGCPDTSAVCNLANVLTQAGHVDEALTLIGPTLEALPEDLPSLNTAAICMNYSDDRTAAEISAAHRHFGAVLSAKHPRDETEFSNQRDPDRRLRVGYLSADMRTHSVAHFLLPIVQNHDRERMETFLYFVGKEDSITPRFCEAADRWRDCAKLDDEPIAEQIHEDGIDILIELGGLFENNRLSVLARRVAPIQITYCGYPNTTGVHEIDYRLIDATTDPAGADEFATEKLLRFDSCFLCYQPLERLDPARRTTRWPDQSVTFGSFNNPAKITSPLIDAWSDLLRQVPRSQLLLKSAGLRDTEVRDRLAAAFVERGVARHRLLLKGFTESRESHLGLYRQVDVALDTFPYHGTTTTCEALSMGVPVVTLMGDRHASRVGGSLLQAAGHPEWIAESWAEYLKIAQSLAADGIRLEQIHETLAKETLGSELCEPRGFVQRLEQAYRAVWIQWCRRGNSDEVAAPGDSVV